MREFITSDHTLDYSMDDMSPLGKIYDSNGHVLLLGVDHRSNTSLHLAEYRSSQRSKWTVICSAPVLEGGKRVWIRNKDIKFNGDGFEQIGVALMEAGKCTKGTLGDSDSFFMSQRDLVDFAKEWMEKNRG